MMSPLQRGRAGLVAPTKQMSFDFRNARPPTAPTLPLKSRDYGTPAGSSAVKLHQLLVYPEGGAMLSHGATRKRRRARTISGY
jgi:hypothetical protein